MESKTKFLFDLIENIISIFNKLYNLSFILALFFVYSEISGNKKLYWLATLMYAFLLFYIIWLSHKLYINKGDKIISLNMLGFILCISFSSTFLSLTFSVTAVINMITVNL